MLHMDRASLRHVTHGQGRLCHTRTGQFVCMSESCHTWTGQPMSHMDGGSHVAYESCRTWMGHVISHMDGASDARERVVSHTWMCHVTRWMCHVTRVNALRHSGIACVWQHSRVCVWHVSFRVCDMTDCESHMRHESPMWDIQSLLCATWLTQNVRHGSFRMCDMTHSECVT